MTPLTPTHQSKKILWLKPLIFAAVLCTVSYAGTLVVQKEISKAFTVTPDSLTACFAKSTDPTFASKCLHQTVEALLKTHSTRALMTFITASSTSARTINDCHPIGHIIGEETFKKYGTIEQALSACSTKCRFACAHGAIGAGVLQQLGTNYDNEDIAHSDQKSLEKIGVTYCKANASLCHAVGHLFYITDGSLLPNALSGCEHIATGVYREACFQGVFMQRAGGSQALNAFTASDNYEIRPDDYTYPCLTLAPAYRRACFQFLPTYQSRLFHSSGATSTKELITLGMSVCENNNLSVRDRASCFEGLGIQTGTVYHIRIGKSAALLRFCNQMPTPADKSACILGVTPRFFFSDNPAPPAIDFCSGVTEPDRRAICFRALFQQWEATYTSKQRSMMETCGTVPACSAEYTKYALLRDTLPDYRFGLYGELPTLNR